MIDDDGHALPRARRRAELGALRVGARKRIHSFLRGSSGGGGDLDDDARRVFDEVTERNAVEFRELIKPEDVIINAPKPASLVPTIRDVQVLSGR